MPESTSNNAPPTGSLSIPHLMVAAVGLIAAQALFVYLLPRLALPAALNRVWGFHFIKYYSTPASIAFYIVALLAVVPQTQRFAAVLFSTARLRRLVDVAARHKTAFFLLASLIAIIVFWNLRSKYALLGDSTLRVDNVVRRDFLVDELATIWVYHYAYKALKALFEFDGVRSVALCACLCGGVYVYFSLRLADTIGRDLYQKAALAAGMCAVGTIQNFFGYIEVYALVLSLLVAFFYYSIRAMRGTAPMGIALLIFCAAALAHLVALFFAPAVLFVIWSRLHPRFAALRNPRVVLPVVGAATLALVFALRKKLSSYLFLVITTTPGDMSLFSYRHYWEWFNGHVLAAGPTLLVSVPLSAWLIKRSARLTMEQWFLVVASISSLLATFVFRTIYGSLDWDITSTAAIAYTPALLWLIFSQPPAFSSARVMRYAVGVLLALMVLNTAPWIHINATDKSIVRLEDILLTDPGYYWISHPPEMVLGIVFNENGLDERALSWYRQAFETYPDDPRMGYNYAQQLMQREDHDSAYAILTRLVEQFPFYILAYGPLVAHYEEQGRREEQTRLMLQLHQVFVRNQHVVLQRFPPRQVGSMFLDLARHLTDARRFTDAEHVVRTLLKLSPRDPNVPYILAVVRANTSDTDEAMRICEGVMKGAPGFIPPYLLAAEIHARANRTAEAAEVLRTAHARATNQATRHSIEQQLSRLGVDVPQLEAIP